MKSLSLSKPHVIVMIGIPGSGKSFFAEKFAETFNAPYVHLQKAAALANVSLEVIRPVIDYQLDELLKTRQSIIVEGIGETRAARMDFAKKARASDYEMLLLWVQIDQATAKSRVVKQGSSVTTVEFDKAVRRFTVPNAIEKPIVISGKHTYASQAKVVLKKLSAPRAEIINHTTAPARQSSQRRNITIR